MPFLMMSVLFSCGQKFTRIDPVPERRAVVYVYNNTESLTDFDVFIHLGKDNITNAVRRLDDIRGSVVPTIALEKIHSVRNVQSEADYILRANRYAPLTLRAGKLEILISSQSSFPLPHGTRTLYDYGLFEFELEAGEEYFIRAGFNPESLDNPLEAEFVDKEIALPEISGKVRAR